MNKTQLYHEAYVEAYNQSDNSSKTEGSSKNVLPFLIFICLPFIFAIVLNFLLLNNKDNEPQITLNKYNNFSDEIIYKNILGKDTLDNKINNTRNQLFFQDNYTFS